MNQTEYWQIGIDDYHFDYYCYFKEIETKKNVYA